MHPYLIHTEYAARGLIHLAHSGQAELHALVDRRNVLERASSVASDVFRSSDAGDDYDEGRLNALHARAAQLGNAAVQAATQASALAQELKNRTQALQALCAALLQIGKQGIALVHGGLQNAPPGRILTPSTVALATVIWQARNQAMHFEDGMFRQPVLDCFSDLSIHFGAQFDLTTHQKSSRAQDVVMLLGWTTYETYVKDMQQLLP